MIITVVKIGGNVVDSPDALRSFIAAFARLEGPKVLVHGGGKEASRLSKTLGIETKMIEGRRVTDAATLDVCTMVYAGLVNKRVVSLLQSQGSNAVGICGADGHAITAKRRTPEPIDYGYVGDINANSVDIAFLQLLIDNGYTPVVCAMQYDGADGLLNCNADSVAQSVATAMARVGETRLVYCFELPGVLDGDKNVISHIDEKIFKQLRADGIVSGGMLPKIENALKAVYDGVQSVAIKSADDLLNSHTGTIIYS